MNVTCADRERIFLDGTAEEWTALEAHAASCEGCAEELRAWKELSLAAAEMREHQDDPALWSRIAVSLEQQAAKDVRRENRWAFLRFGWSLPQVWQTALAGALGIVIGTAFQAFHASQGAEMGLPQMIQSRAQFGYRPGEPVLRDLVQRGFLLPPGPGAGANG